MNPNLTRAAEAPIVEFKASLPKRSGKTFDMSQAVPSYGTFRPIIDGLKEDLEEFSTGFYTAVEGLRELREQIKCTHPLARSLEVDTIFITAGANHAMYTALAALFTPGDTVTLLEPYYFNYDMALSMLGLRADHFVLSPENSFQLDPPRLLAHLERSGSKGLILITPNNPTGATYSSEAIKAVVQGCARLGIEVLLDETYAVFDPRHLSDETLGDWLNANLSLIGSFSKAFSLTGYRVGYWAFQPERRTEVLKMQDTMIICASHIGQRAALRGIRECQKLVAEKCRALYQKAELVQAWFCEPRKFKLRSLGPFFAYVEHPYAGLSARDAATQLYKDTGILSLPGSVFGKSQEKFLRLAYENLSLEHLPQALQRL